MKITKKHVIGIYDGKPNRNGIVMQLDCIKIDRDKTYPLVTHTINDSDEVLVEHDNDVGYVKLDYDISTQELYTTEIYIKDDQLHNVGERPFICSYGVGTFVKDKTDEFNYEVQGVFLAKEHANNSVEPVTWK